MFGSFKVMYSVLYSFAGREVTPPPLAPTLSEVLKELYTDLYIYIYICSLNNWNLLFSVNRKYLSQQKKLRLIEWDLLGREANLDSGSFGYYIYSTKPCHVAGGGDSSVVRAPDS